MTMTPNQVFTVAAIGGAAGVLALALLAALSYGAGVLANRTGERLCELREQRQRVRAARAARLEFDRLTALYDLPAHDPREHR